MGLRCPKCNVDLEVRLTAAPPMQADQVKPRTNGGGNIQELLEEAEARDLNPWEQEFIGSLRTRFDQYGARTKMSEKQMGILRKIASGEKDEEW